MQVKLWYEKRSYELIITLINAIDLPLTSAGKFRNPYCKIYLLPDRRYIAQIVSFLALTVEICPDLITTLGQTIRIVHECKVLYTDKSVWRVTVWPYASQPSDAKMTEGKDLSIM